MFKRVMIAIALSATLSPLPAYADAASVAKSCAAGGDCMGLVNSEISRFGSSCRVKDKGIADLVVAIGNESQSVAPEAREKMADAVAAAGKQVCNVAQRNRIALVALAMRNNQDIQTAALAGEQASAN